MTAGRWPASEGTHFLPSKVSVWELPPAVRAPAWGAGGGTKYTAPSRRARRRDPVGVAEVRTMRVRAMRILNVGAALYVVTALSFEGENAHPVLTKRSRHDGGLEWPGRCSATSR